MVDLTYDLHIHSCLSPCGDDDMTPGNIIGMAKLKGLDVIALTDHNSCRNCPSFMKQAEEFGILALPGMEINTSEEVHAICLFATLDQAMKFDTYVYQRLIPFPNKEEVFGTQQIYDDQDLCVGTEPLLLIHSVDISFEGLWELVNSFGGVMIPAHIEKSTNSLLANLGFVPPDSKFQTVELKNLKELHSVRKSNPYLETCKIISNSDAHYLEDISEPNLTISVVEKTPEAILGYLRGI